jgi:hemerythrin-like domain-containing protein
MQFKLIETPIYVKKMAVKSLITAQGASTNTILLASLQRPYDPYAEAASIMALGHNVIIRGLNSIYKQAPYIGPQDAEDFVAYAKCWHEVLDAHHSMEETTLFPEIEKKTGKKGIMDVNVQQHRTCLSRGPLSIVALG